MTPLPAIRQTLFDLMSQTVADEKAHNPWVYVDARPTPVPSAWKPGQRVVGDCSKGCQFLARWAGAPDPMRNGWANWGNSQTMWSVLQPCTQAELEVGDFAIFGPDGSAHAAMVYETGPDPMLWSFGRQGAPGFYRLSQDGREVAFRKLMRDPPVQPAVAALRAQTGFFAWVAWRLGEGDWHSCGPHNGSVRPAVPRVIPPDWWRRYTRFLVNRKKGNPAS